MKGHLTIVRFEDIHNGSGQYGGLLSIAFAIYYFYVYVTYNMNALSLIHKSSTQYYKYVRIRNIKAKNI